MRDHSNDIIIHRPEVKRAISSFGKASHFSLKLSKKSFQRNITRCKNTKISVHRQDYFVFFHCISSSYTDCLLSPTGEPLRNLPLTQKNQHFFFNEARF